MLHYDFCRMLYSDTLTFVCVQVCWVMPSKLKNIYKVNVLLCFRDIIFLLIIQHTLLTNLTCIFSTLHPNSTVEFSKQGANKLSKVNTNVALVEKCQLLHVKLIHRCHNSKRQVQLPNCGLTNGYGMLCGLCLMMLPILLLIAAGSS